MSERARITWRQTDECTQIVLFFDEGTLLDNYFDLLSNRPQVSMAYQLINLEGCWKNTRRIVNHSPAAHDLQILRNIETCGLLLLCSNSEDLQNFHEFTCTINHS